MATRRPYQRRNPHDPRKNGATMTIYWDLTKHGGVKEHAAVRLACRRLALYAGKHHTLCEDQCNGGTATQKQLFYQKRMTYADIEQEHAQREKEIEYNIQQQVLTLNYYLEPNNPPGKQIEVQFQGDPRGCTVRLILPNGYKNGWGDGYGVTHNR